MKTLNNALEIFFVVFILLICQNIAKADLFDVGVEVEVGVNKETQLWALKLYNQLDQTIKSSIGTFDSLLEKHQDNIFDELTVLLNQTSSEIVCLEEDVNQKLIAMLDKLAYETKKIWFFSWGKKPRYPDCKVELIPVSSTGILRKKADCVIEKILEDRKKDIKLEFLAGHYSDMSSAYYAGWCTKIKQPAYSNQDNSLLKKHFELSLIHEALNEAISNNKELCISKNNNLNNCYQGYFIAIEERLKKHDKIDKLNANNELDKLKNIDGKSVVDILSRMGKLKYIDNVIQGKRKKRIQRLTKEYRNLKLEYIRIDQNRKNISSKYKSGNNACQAQNYQVAKNNWDAIDSSIVKNIKEIHDRVKTKHTNLLRHISKFKSSDITDTIKFVELYDKELSGWEKIDNHALSFSSYYGNGQRSQTPCTHEVSNCGTFKRTYCDNMNFN